METVTVELPGRCYNIYIGNGIYHLFAEKLNGLKPGSKAAIVTNPKISGLYLDKLLSPLKDNGMMPLVIEIPDGEEYKTQKWASHIIDRLLEERFDRGSTLIALGGGVIGDITGYVAATFLRGIRYVQVPTTLISQVDSSVGGKTGVNHPKGKNLVGAFHQPAMVFIDTDALSTLDERELRGGMAEVIKYGIIHDKGFFDFLRENANRLLKLEPGGINLMVKRCCGIKAEVVGMDEKEQTGKRAILNYGHTIGHALETLTQYTRYRHGEAVAIGMVAASRLSLHLGYCQHDVVEAHSHITNIFGLPAGLPELDREDIVNTIKLDKKVRDGKINFILCKNIGEVISKTVSPQQIINAL